jgi:thiamine-monophosphate kinase
MPTEFQFLDRLREKYSLGRIGDDCAVLPKDARTDLVVTADLLVEEIDFRLDWTRPEFVGHKALAVSLSDVAAMGARPVWAMVSIGVPEKIWNSDFVDRFYEGWFALAGRHEVELVGGDVSRTPDKIVVDSIVAGETRKSQAVLRSGARPGDLIFVSGELGGAAGGLRLLMNGSRSEETTKHWQNRLIDRQLKPEPEVAAGRAVGSRRLASAMIDLSDGLSSDLFHLCRASGVGAKIFRDLIPLDPNLAGLVQDAEQQFQFALNGGEDFKLLFTVAPDIFFGREKLFEKHSFFRLGEVTANTEIIELVAPSETSVIEPRGFRHF